MRTIIIAAIAAICWCVGPAAAHAQDSLYRLPTLPTLPNMAPLQPMTSGVDFRPLYQPTPGLYDFQMPAPAVQPLMRDGAADHRQWMRNFEAQRAQQAELYQRMVERNRSRIQQSKRSFLERCAQYNRGCFQQLGR